MIDEINKEFNEDARKKALKSVGASSLEENEGKEGGSEESSEKNKAGTLDKVKNLKDKIEMSVVLQNNIKELI